MQERSLHLMRNAAAAMMCLSGCVHIAGLWFREIDGTTLLTALFGSVYLMIGIGLYGVSRFTLFMAIVTPAAGAAMALRYTPLATMSSVAAAQVLTDLVVMALCTVVLYQVRDNPSI